jgi:hypothetical protein
VEQGGHDVPADRIRERYDSGRINIVRLLPLLKEFWLYDNSDEVDLTGGSAPEPRFILYMRDGQIEECCDLRDVPKWAKPIVAAAIAGE